MTDQRTDRDLLDAFVGQASQEAFAELVARHIGWVTAAAKRRLRDSALADDATQATFILLAQKASKLRRETVLSAWLFSALRYTCIATLRSERRRKSREEQAAIMRQANTPETDIWPDVAEHLDDAVARLRKRDRRAVLLRFFENKSFMQLGAALGISEEAARKRVDRAVEKLASLLRRRGAGATTSLLAAAMVTNLATPSSASVATVAATALGAATASTSTVATIAQTAGSMLAWAQAKAAVLVIAATTLGVAAAGGAGVAIAQSIATRSAKPQAAVTTAPAASIPAPAQSAAGKIITGRVVTPDNKPVAAAAVLAVSNDWSHPKDADATAKTDADGRFRLSLPKGSTAFIFVVDAAPWGYSPGHFSDAGEYALTLKPAAEVEVTLLAPDGSPAGNIMVAPGIIAGGSGAMEDSWSLYIPHSLASSIAQRTDANGRVRMTRLPAGARTRLHIFDERFAQPTYEDSVRTIASGASPAQTVKLRPGAAIAGRVTLPGGKPAPGVKIGAQGMDDAEAAWGGTITDADGKYRIAQLLPGPYNIIADFGKGDDSLPPFVAVARERVAAPASATLDNIDFAGTLGVFIRGKVTARDTKLPLPGIYVGSYGPARPRSGGAILGTSTAADGTYAFRVPPGEHYVYLASQLPEGYNAGAQHGDTIQVGDSGATYNFDIRPAPGKPVAGTVVTADGKPAPNAWVSAVDANNRGPFDQRQVQADARGRFAFKRLTNGSVLKAGLGTLRSAKPVKVKGGETNVVLRVEPETLVTLRGRVVSDTGKPIPGAKVTLFVQHGAISTGSTVANTDERGEYTLDKLRVGDDYHLDAQANRFGRVSSPVTLKPGQATLAQPPIVLPRADSFVMGTVVDESGKPMAGLTLHMGGSKTLSQKTMTDPQGRFEFADVVAGERLRFSFRHEGQYVDGGEADAGMLDAKLKFKKPPSKK